MKRVLAIGGIVLVLALAGWGAAWWAGRGEVGRDLDAGVARLGEQGWTVAWEDRHIGGFPFGYVVRLEGLTARDAETGFALTLPWATAATDGTDRIIVRMPESFTAGLPVPAPARQADPDLPEAIAAPGQAEDLVLVLTPDGATEVTADSLGWTIEIPGGGRRITQRVEGLEATMVPDAPGVRYRVHAAQVALDGETAGPEGEPSTVTASVADLTLEGGSTLSSPEELAAMLYAGAPGQAEGSLRAGAAEVRVASTGATPGLLDWRAEGISGEAALSSGRMELQGETRGNAWTLSSPDQALPVQGTLSVGLARAHYAVPMAPSERPDEMAVGLVLQDAVADEAVWATVDPDGALPREPASLAVDVTGTLRVTERIDRLRPGAAPPFELSGLVLREVAADALGASLRATGEIEILQPIGVPLGEVRIGVTGLEALVRALGSAGVLSPAAVTTAEAIMAVYLRPAEGADAWTATVELTHQGTLVNGMPVR